jgi:hypothetical protein
MRWMNKAKQPTPYGARRVRSRFLILPKTLNGETRWLEVAFWEEELVEGDLADYWCQFCWVGCVNSRTRTGFLAALLARFGLDGVR